jgi:hypothetical protein
MDYTYMWIVVIIVFIVIPILGSWAIYRDSSK